MANGDVAATEAGYTSVLPAEDFRLGYDRINTVADLAVKRGQRAAGTAAALAAIVGSFVGQLVTRTDNRITYRWNGTTWRPWASPWIGYTPSIPTLTVGGGGGITARYRYESGLVHVRVEVTQGSSSAITGPATMTLPTNASYNFRRPIGFLQVMQPSGPIYDGFVLTRGVGSNIVDLFVNRADGTYVSHANVTTGVPAAATQSAVWRIEFVYEDNDNPVDL